MLIKLTLELESSRQEICEKIREKSKPSDDTDQAVSVLYLDVVDQATAINLLSTELFSSSTVLVLIDALRSTKSWRERCGS